MADCNAVAARQLDLLDLVGERIHQRFEFRRHDGAAIGPLVESVGQRTDAVFEMVERIHAGAGHRDLLDLFGQRLHFGGKLPHRLVGGDVRGHPAQRGDGAFELLHGRGILLRDDQVDFLR